MVGLDHLAGSSQCVYVGHKKSKFYINFMVGEGFLTMCFSSSHYFGYISPFTTISKIWLEIVLQTWTISEISRLCIVILYLLMIIKKKNLLFGQIILQVCTRAFQSVEQDRPSLEMCNQSCSKRKFSVK